MSRIDRDLDDSTRFILESYRKDIDKLDEKWDQYLVGIIRLEEGQKTMYSQAQKLTKLLTEDNGKPSIISQLGTLTDDVKSLNDTVNQLRSLTTDVHTINSTVNEIKSDLTTVRRNSGIQTPKEVSVERWKTIGLLGTGLLTTIPGILAFIHSFM